MSDPVTVENKVKYGLSNVYIAPITALSSAGAPTYGTPAAMPGAVSLTLSPKGEIKKFRADNMDYYVVDTRSGYEGSLEMAVIPEWFRSTYLGEALDAKNVLVEKANLQPTAFALLFQFEGDERETKHAIYNCVASRPDVSSKTTEEDDLDIQTETLSITSMPVYSSALSEWIIKARTGKDTDSTTESSWFTAVQLPTASS